MNTDFLTELSFGSKTLDVRKKGRPRKRPDIEEFYYFYDDKSYPIEELCDRWKVKKQTIYQWNTYYKKILRGGGKTKKGASLK